MKQGKRAADAGKPIVPSARALLESNPWELFSAEVRAVATERARLGTRFTPTDVADLLEAYHSAALPDLVRERACSSLRNRRGEIGRPTPLCDEAVLRIAHREYKVLLPRVQADDHEPDSAFDPYRRKRWWDGPPNERAFQLVVWRYRALLPDREDATLRRLIRVRKSTKKKPLPYTTRSV